MYRRLLWLAIVCIFVFAAGCDSKETKEKADYTKKPVTAADEENKKDNDTTNEKPDSNHSPDSEPSTGNNENEQDETSAPTSEIKKSTEHDGDRTIHYPQLVMQDASEKRKNNDLIYSRVTAYASQYDGGKLVVDFQIIWHTDDTLSILYNAEFNGGMYPSEHIFTTNIDLRNGEEITLSDVVVINEDFVNKLKNSTYLDSENLSSPNNEKKVAVLDYLNNIPVAELVSALKHADEVNTDTNLYSVYSYIQGDSVVVSIGVPHALGDHADFRISLD